MSRDLVPTLACDRCKGLGRLRGGKCPRCWGEGRVPDVAWGHLAAELEPTGSVIIPAPRPELSASIMPPWPDELMERLMEALAPFEGHVMTVTTFEGMVSAARAVVDVCKLRGVLAPDALAGAAEVDEAPGVRVIAVRDRTICDHDLIMQPSNVRPGDARPRHWDVLPPELRRLGRE